MTKQKYFRRVIRIRAEDSPNVRLALAQARMGEEVTNEVLVAGVLTYEEYLNRRATWDPIRQAVGLDAIFYEGRELLLYPPDWLDMAERRWLELRGRKRQATCVGIDPAEGGDKTSMAAGDELGLIELVSKKTPDTSVIVGEAIAFMNRHGVPPERVCIDRGGGGKQHADTMRSLGYNIRTVAFGESLTLDPKRGMRMIEERKEIKEEHYSYINRRAQMYGELRLLMEPSAEVGFALPPGSEGDLYAELRRQLAPMPLLYDPEGRMRLLPKNKRSPDSTEKTLVDLIGHSPDEADAVVLMLHARLHTVKRMTAGAL